MPYPSYVNVGLYNRGRLKPAELLQVPGRTKPIWVQDGVNKRLKEKPHYHLVWPRDRKTTMFGRLKDIIQGKGPDIHLSYSALKEDYSTNRPLHGRWSGWEYLDPRLQPGPNMWPGQYKFGGPPWVNNTKLLGRDPAMLYNFGTRKYERYHSNMCSGAVWQGPYMKFNLPDQYRTVRGSWKQDRNWIPSTPRDWVY